MGYMHINNLYRLEARNILLFKRIFSLEKVHGTSSRVTWRLRDGVGNLMFFSGGSSYEEFKEFFNERKLATKFHQLGYEDIVVYGEAYGGKCQGMSKTYGDTLRFIAFDVKVRGKWLDVKKAEELVLFLGLEFVPYREVEATEEAINAERDRLSEVALLRGMGNHIREGVVLRPLQEFLDGNGNRVMAKHKRAEFSERRRSPGITDEENEVLREAGEVAWEWVTDMRLQHVLDFLGNPNDMRFTKIVINGMVEDIYREGKGELEESDAVRKAIGTATAKLYKEHINRSKFVIIDKTWVPIQAHPIPVKPELYIPRDEQIIYYRKQLREAGDRRDWDECNEIEEKIEQCQQAGAAECGTNCNCHRVPEDYNQR